MVDRQTGLTATSPNNFVVDAGAIFVNDQPIGATQEGASFVLEQSIRTPAIDGARGPIMGTRRVVNTVARITFSPMEWTAVNFRRFIAGAQGNPVTRSVYVFGKSFHFEKLSLIGTTQAGKEIVCTIYNALGDGEEISAAMEDEGEATPEIRMTAHFDPTNQGGKEPWEIKFPS